MKNVRLLAAAGLPLLLGVLVWAAHQRPSRVSARRPRTMLRSVTERGGSDPPAETISLGPETVRLPERPETGPSILEPIRRDVESDPVRLENWLLTRSAEELRRLRKSPDFDRYVAAVTESRMEAGGPAEKVLAGAGRFLADLNERIPSGQ